MKPSVTLAQTTTPEGMTLSLRTHDGQYHMRIGSDGLMSTTATSSEMRLAEVACENLAPREHRRVLIGGLGFGFTLRRVLEVVGADVKVEVAELLPVIVSWNRQYLQSVNGALVDDPRVEILIEDVCAVLARAEAGRYDAVLLDIDNGPQALVDRGNARLYEGGGLKVLSRALRVGGRAVFWSLTEDRSFVARLERAGFRAEVVVAKAYPKAKRSAHTLFVADRLA
jgi:spermidine synthase